MIKSILKAINDHADSISELLGGRPKLIPIKLVCRDCTAPLDVKTMNEHKCLTRRVEDLRWK